MNSKPSRSSTVRQANDRTNDVRMEHEQVFRLLDALEKLDSSDRIDLDLEQLRSELEDACWLADWKREYVLLDESTFPIEELNKVSVKCR